MTKKYVIQRVRVSADANLKIKADLMNRTLQNLKIKGRINKIDVLDILSKQPLYMTDREVGDLIKKAKRKII